MNEKKVALKVSIVSIAVNILLSAFKLIAGLLAHSGAMISDAVHSLSDVLSTFVVMIGVSISNKESDQDHQYGHERLESVAAIILSALLFITGIGIGLDGIKKVMASQTSELVVPGALALVAAVFSILIKEWMYWYTRSAAKKINSGALMADAWHHRSDALSSVGSFVGILGARLGMPVLDPLASVVICIFIAKAAYDIFMDDIDKLVDRSCDDKTVQKITDITNNQQGVLAVDEIRTRLFGNKIYVDIEISADGDQSLFKAHAIAQELHDKIENEFPLVKHCMIHVNPYQDKA